MRETRTRSNAVRVVDTAKHQLEIEGCVYGVVDDYKTRWVPGVFTRSIEQRQPPLVWAHNWADPIGAMVDYEDDKTSLRALYQLDDFDAVPRARQAWAQYHSRTVTDASFGFSRSVDEPAEDLPGVYDIREADMDEQSLVLRGAVPGVGIVGSRAAGLLVDGIVPGMVPVEFTIDLATRLEKREISIENALASIGRIAQVDADGGVRALHSHAKKDGSGSVDHSHSGDPMTHAHSGLMPMKAKRAVPALDAPEPDGDEATIKCPNCGTVNEADAKFCDQCASLMTHAAVNRSAEQIEIDEARKLLQEIGR